MKLQELKQNFYKRYEQSDNFLHFTSTGLVCPLLGHNNIENTPSLTCSLSMRVQMFARRLGGNSIDIQDVTGNEEISYRFGTPNRIVQGIYPDTVNIIHKFEKYGISGAQILYERTIPDFLQCNEEFAVCLVRSLLKISQKDMDTKKILAIASSSEKNDKYLAAASEKKGYCTAVSKGEVTSLPLPLSGYKILSAHCNEKDKDRNPLVLYAFNRIRRLYPHISSVADITPAMFVAVKNEIKDKTALRYMYHLINENARLGTVTRALKRCDIKTLFNEMNSSQKSIERFWNLNNEQLYLARCAKNIEGVFAVRSWQNGIVTIVKNEYIDNAINTVKTNFENNIGYQPYFCVSDVF